MQRLLRQAKIPGDRRHPLTTGDQANGLFLEFQRVAWPVLFSSFRPHPLADLTRLWEALHGGKVTTHGQSAGTRHIDPGKGLRPQFRCHRIPFDASSVVHFRSSLQSIHDVFISRLLTVTFTTAAFRTEAAYGCLKPAPASRLRRAFLHLRHSTVFSEHVLGTTNPRNFGDLLFSAI